MPMEEIMKVKIDRDEWYPVYVIDSNYKYGEEIELSEKEIAFIQQASEIFRKAQEFIVSKLEDR
jgi:hypothetical protein